MSSPKSKSPHVDGTVSQVMSDRMVWFEGPEDSTVVRIQEPPPDVPPLTDQERAELEAWIAQTRSQPSAASREALAEIDMLLAELGDAGQPLSSIRERIRRIRTLLAQG